MLGCPDLAVDVVRLCVHTLEVLHSPRPESGSRSLGRISAQLERSGRANFDVVHRQSTGAFTPDCHAITCGVDVLCVYVALCRCVWTSEKIGRSFALIPPYNVTIESHPSTCYSSLVRLNCAISKNGFSLPTSSPGATIVLSVSHLYSPPFSEILIAMPRSSGLIVQTHLCTLQSSF